MVPTFKVVDYIAKRYKGSRYLPFSVLSYILFLADWEYAITHDRTISDACWFLSPEGPSVKGLFDTLVKSEIPVHKISHFGQPKYFVVARPWLFLSGSDLPRDQREIIDRILGYTQRSEVTEIIKRVVTSYPLLTSTIGQDLDLITLSAEFKRNKDMLEPRRKKQLVPS